VVVAVTVVGCYSSGKGEAPGLPTVIDDRAICGIMVDDKLGGKHTGIDRMQSSRPGLDRRSAFERTYSEFC
jgi:hypothetical protein